MHQEVIQSTEPSPTISAVFPVLIYININQKHYLNGLKFFVDTRATPGPSASI